MAIAFVAAGTPIGGNTGTTGLLINVPTPAGLAANQLLVMAVSTDDTKGPTTPSGWKKLGSQTTSIAPSQSPYYAPPRLTILYKIASGSEGPTVPVTFDFHSWPDGYPYYVASIVSYSGTDLTSPIGEWGSTSSVLSLFALNHNIITTTVNSDWLLTVRAGSGNTGAATYTISGGTNSERVDATDGIPELSMSFYDSNGALATGAQTQRVTTASAAPNFGSAGFSIAIRPPTSTQALATPDEANAIGTAYNPTVVIVNGPWDTCAVMPPYAFLVDWNNDGDYTDPGDDITSDVLSGGISVSYGRDQSRQLSPTKMGTASCSLDNTNRTYSPENAAGPLYGDLDPARVMKGDVTFLGTSYALGRMRIDDYNITADMDNRTLDLTFLDGLKSLDGVTLSTPLLSTMRTGDLINFILDQAGWTAPRDIDPGATIVPWWWAEGTTAFAAIQDLVWSEGPPSIAYVALDGTFVFRDRHHRILRTTSLVPQAYFSQNKLNDCTSPAATGLSFTAPFQYAHGWRDIVNSVSFDVSVRGISNFASVWQYGNPILLTIGQSVTVNVSGSDPFLNAITPAAGVDYTLTGIGTVQVTMTRTSGLTTQITLLAVGGSVTVTGLQLRAQPLPVVSTIPVSRTDTESIAGHGEQPYPNPAPWATVEDAYAIAGTILLHYAQRRPTVQLRITASDPRHLWEILNRKISDRIRITYGEMGLNDDFFIETITHQISRMNKPNQPPVHSVVFGCEKNLGAPTANPFRFDVRGSGFDQGQFDPLVGDNASTVFVFDDPRGAFDVGVFGT